MILDFERMSLQVRPLPALPSMLPEDSSDIMIEGDSMTIPVEPDLAVQSPMPHILEWKRVIQLCGATHFVPQTVYQPYTEADRQRYIRDMQVQDTIFFSCNDSSELGVSLGDALGQGLGNLKDKNDPMFVGCGLSVSIRIQWPGYAPWSKQIPTMDFKTPKGPISRAKLAKSIATCVRRFTDSVEGKPMEAQSDIRWKIGKSHIRVEDLILVSLHHVSKWGWQPQLRLARPPIVSSFDIHLTTPLLDG